MEAGIAQHRYTRYVVTAGFMLGRVRPHLQWYVLGDYATQEEAESLAQGEAAVTNRPWLDLRVIRRTVTEDVLTVYPAPLDATRGAAREGET